MAASKLIEELGADPRVYLSKYLKFGGIVDAHASIDEFKELLSNIIYKVFELRDESTGSKYSEVIAKAKDYIQKNFAEQDISLHSVAKAVNVSPNHFSTIFSQETGETFIGYITKIRIERAKVLLKTTNLRTTDIGYEVGYNDAHYFSYVFKKNTTMTPKEFRK
jgi:two-component system response regulator YesN